MEHQHQLDWATEGPLWFCKCGAEFYPGVKPTITVSVTRPFPAKRRIRVSTHKS